MSDGGGVTQPGSREPLHCDTVTTDPRIPCVEEYLDCVRRQTGQPLVHEEKSRIHAYIAGRDQPWLLVGQAAQARYFPWVSPVFDEIKNFVQGLLPPTP
jgi:hypothetical protein